MTQDGSHQNTTGLYINNHRHLKDMFKHFHEKVSGKFLLQYNVAARKGIKTPVKCQSYISIKIDDVHMQYIQFLLKFAAETDVVLNIYTL